MIALWVADVGATGVIPRSAADWLAPEERERLGRLRGSWEKRQYLVSRIAVRGLLSRATGIAPGALRFDTSGEEGGKPRLVLPRGERGPAFNVSHAGNAVVVAVSSDREVGVDIERVPTDSKEELDPSAFLSEAEQAGLPTPEEDRPRALARLWTMKEAYAKLLGRGLEFEPSELSLPRDGGEVEIEYRELELGGARYVLSLASRPRTVSGKN